MLFVDVEFGFELLKLVELFELVVVLVDFYAGLFGFGLEEYTTLCFGGEGHAHLLLLCL